MLAIRVLVRRSIPSKLAPISPNSLQKIRFSSQSPDFPRKCPPRSSPWTSPYSNQIAIASLLRRYGFPQSNLHEFVQRNRFVSDFNPSDVENCIKILLSFGFSQNSLLSIVSSCPMALDLEFLRKWQGFFSELGPIPPSVVQKLLEQSGKFSIRPDDLRPILRFMKDMGFRNETLRRLLGELPLGLLKDSAEIGDKVDILKRIGLDMDEIDRICCSFPGYFALDFEGSLRLLFQEFYDLGFTQNEVRKAINKDPRLLLSMEVGELSRCMELLKSLKCRHNIKEKIFSRGYLRAVIDVKLRVDGLHRHGLILRDAFKILFVEPRIILYDLEDIEKKIDFLLHNIKFCIEYLIECPEYLGVNLEKQIIPRYNVIVYLRSIGGLGDEVGMKHFVKLSRLKFYNLFVKPYPECEKIFGGPKREVEVRPRHPTAMWKLFKPQRYPNSKEDIHPFCKPQPGENPLQLLCINETITVLIKHREGLSDLLQAGLLLREQARQVVDARRGLVVAAQPHAHPPHYHLHILSCDQLVGVLMTIFTFMAMLQCMEWLVGGIVVIWGHECGGEEICVGLEV
ncbi:hypothetical protein ACMD2_13099 [Ananas comosus]|uniref:Transcription termination factor MTERF15, mitochondrial n=1 Tax=Ananas comosus TaxID=4615 RepID=A0A199UJL8_ANACO|nr:hypothetical protein ACMD2_13099 [Ananas comosus]